MLAKTNIRNYKSKKYASRLKNKKRSKLKGGGNVTPLPVNHNGFQLVRQSRKTIYKEKKESIQEACSRKYS